MSIHGPRSRVGRADIGKSNSALSLIYTPVAHKNEFCRQVTVLWFTELVKLNPGLA
jgi:hypothetical protein